MSEPVLVRLLGVGPSARHSGPAVTGTFDIDGTRIDVAVVWNKENRVEEVYPIGVQLPIGKRLVIVHQLQEKLVERLQELCQRHLESLKRVES
jgi:hypothetical protein